MQQYVNQRLIRRNRTNSRLMMFGGLGASIAAVIITFTQPALIIFAFLLILVGGLVSQVGTSIHNRFGRSPRIDEVIDFSLKGLDDRHAIFHYYLGTHHALFTPNGAYAILPMLEKGTITFAGGSWLFSPVQRRIRIGRAQKTLRSLPKDAAAEAKRLERYLRKNIPRQRDIVVEPLVLFLANDTYVHSEEADILAVHRKKLKDALKKASGRPAFSSEDIRKLAEYLNLT